MIPLEQRICARCGESASDGITDAGEYFCKWCAAVVAQPAHRLDHDLLEVTHHSHLVPAGGEVIYVSDAKGIIVERARAAVRAERQRIEASLRQLLASVDDERFTSRRARDVVLSQALEIVHAQDAESAARIEALFAGDPS